MGCRDSGTGLIFSARRPENGALSGEKMTECDDYPEKSG